MTAEPFDVAPLVAVLEVENLLHRLRDRPGALRVIRAYIDHLLAGGK